MTMLEVENLTKRFGGLTAVDNLSFSVSQGEVQDGHLAFGRE